MAKYGKQPKKEVTEKEKKAAEFRRQSVRKTPKKKKKAERQTWLVRWIDALPPKKAKLYLRGGIGACALFIVAATFIIVNLFMVSTPREKINPHTTELTFAQLMDIHEDIQRKYQFNAMSGRPPSDGSMTEADAYNFALLDFMRMNELTRIFGTGGPQGYDQPGEFYFFEPDGVTDIIINDDGTAVPVSFEARENGYAITIAGAEFVKEDLEWPDNMVTAIRYGGDRNYLLVCSDNSFSHLSSRSFVYYFDGVNAFYAGELPVGITGLREISAPGVAFMSQNSVIQDWFIFGTAVLDGADSLVPGGIPAQGYYDFTAFHSVFSLAELTAYAAPEKEADSFTLPAAITFDIVGTDNESFIRCHSQFGFFYLHMPRRDVVEAGDGSHVPIGELLYGLD
ncbi:MAG: hypothetical protein FWE91_02425 [Defluviitaleaceae bacterium]|nr:hypothetical protein [Defluviitaleaceae bacterium]MCL2835163.1 hypothetical protein [Defluviitaleaceae bacterium]